MHSMRLRGLGPHVLAVLMVVATAAMVQVTAAQDARSMQDDKPAQDQSAAGGEEQETESKEPEFVYARMTTSKGDIILQLNRKEAPISVDNFMQYVEDEFYDSTIFHRVIAHFMIQGGGYTADMTKKQTREPISNEWQNDLSNEPGTIAMARLGGQPDSATSQFFINVADNNSLDQPQRDGAGYAVFGKVYAGMDTVDAIRNVEVQPSPLNRERSFPAETVVIEKVRKISEDEAQKAKEAMAAEDPKPSDESASEDGATAPGE